MKLNKIAAILSFIIGGMAIFAGGQVVFLGKIMDYYVIDWLPVYNLIVGVISLFVTTVLLWKDMSIAFSAAIATLSAHIIVLLTIRFAYGDVVAPDSLRAMTVRIVVWLIIITLEIFHRKKQAQESTK